MKKINRNNYEIYLIDYLDGKLNPLLMDEIHSFFQENPDLKKEFENISSIKLNPDKIVYEEKIILKKYISKSIVNESNFSDFCIARFEDDLNADEIKALDNYIKENPTKKPEYQLFALSRLETDTSIIFENKRKIKHIFLAQTEKRILYSIISVAASLLLVVSTWFYSKINNPEFIASKLKLDNAIETKQLIASNYATENTKIDKNNSVNINKVKLENIELLSCVEKAENIKVNIIPNTLDTSIIKVEKITDYSEFVLSDLSFEETEDTINLYKEVITGVKELFREDQRPTASVTGWVIADLSVKTINKLTESNYKFKKDPSNNFFTFVANNNFVTNIFKNKNKDIY